jgi:hypothetical protein
VIFSVVVWSVVEGSRFWEVKGVLEEVEQTEVWLEFEVLVEIGEEGVVEEEMVVVVEVVAGVLWYV